MRCVRGSSVNSVPMSATGISGAPVASARRAAPRLYPRFWSGSDVPFGEEPDARALLEQGHASGHGPAGVGAAVDRKRARGVEDLLDHRHLVQLRLRHEAHLTRDGDAEKEAVHHRDVVRRQDARSRLGDVLTAGDPHAIDGHEGRPQDLLDDRVDGAVGVHYDSWNRSSSPAIAVSQAPARGSGRVRPLGARTAAPWRPPRTIV